MGLVENEEVMNNDDEESMSNDEVEKTSVKLLGKIEDQQFLYDVPAGKISSILYALISTLSKDFSLHKHFIKTFFVHV